eukprot:scaffold162_cov176-Amphora_coffeaeformis.AAC.24
MNTSKPGNLTCPCLSSALCLILHWNWHRQSLRSHPFASVCSVVDLPMVDLPMIAPFPFAPPREHVGRRSKLVRPRQTDG